MKKVSPSKISPHLLELMVADLSSSFFFCLYRKICKTRFVCWSGCIVEKRGSLVFSSLSWVYQLTGNCHSMRLAIPIPNSSESSQGEEGREENSSDGHRHPPPPLLLPKSQNARGIAQDVPPLINGICFSGVWE